MPPDLNKQPRTTPRSLGRRPATAGRGTRGPAPGEWATGWGASCGWTPRVRWTAFIFIFFCGLVFVYMCMDLCLCFCFWVYVTPSTTAPPSFQRPASQHTNKTRTGEIEESQNQEAGGARGAHPLTNAGSGTSKPGGPRRPGPATLAFQTGGGSGRGLLNTLGYGTVTDFGDVESPRYVLRLAFGVWRGLGLVGVCCLSLFLLFPYTPLPHRIDLSLPLTAITPPKTT